MELKRTHTNGIECCIRENSRRYTVLIKFKNDKAPGILLDPRQLTVEEAKELADNIVKNSGHTCRSACSDWVRFLVAP
jgi:transcription initiation factor IIE alpha subunit